LGLLAFFFGASAFAQSGNEGSIEGLIIDPSGAVIFGVNVTARDIDTAAIYCAVTDGDGKKTLHRFTYPIARAFDA